MGAPTGHKIVRILKEEQENIKEALTLEEEQDNIKEALEELEDLPMEVQELEEVQDAIQELQGMEDQYEDMNNPQEEDDDCFDHTMPVGKLGLRFKGRRTPAIVSYVDGDGPLGAVKDKILGMAVDYINIDGVDHYQLNSKAAAELLADSKHLEGRVMRVRPRDSTLFKMSQDDPPEPPA